MANETLDRQGWTPRFADRMQGVQASEIRELLKLIERPGVISFAGGIPDPVLFPQTEIQQAYEAILGSNSDASRALQYSVSEGDAELRGWIAGHMRGKGVECTPENILITSGSQQGLEFLGKLLISPGDPVLVQAPTYLGALQAFAPNRPTYETLDTQGDAATGERPALAYVVPDFANPSGETLSIEPRRALLDLARTRDCPIIEDSPYDVLRFQGTAQPALLAMEAADVGIDKSRVIYCGSFSKVFTPGLRVGWVCAAREVIDRLTLLKQSGDLNSPAINQRVMLQLAQHGFDTQVDRACAAYRKKRDAMVELMAETLPTGSRWSRPDGGMFIWVELPGDFDAKQILHRAIEDHGVAFVPGHAFYARDPKTNTLRLSYSLPSLPEIESGMRRLKNCLSDAP